MIKFRYFWILFLLELISASIDESHIFSRLNSSEYAQLKNSTNHDYLVIFYDPSCRYCTRAKQNIASVSPIIKEIFPNFGIYKVNVIEESEAADSEQIFQVPTIFLKKAGFDEPIVLPIYQKNHILNSVLKSFIGGYFLVPTSEIGQKILDIGESSFIFTGSIDDPEFEEFERISSELFPVNTFFLHIDEKTIAKEMVIPRKDSKFILHLAYNDQVIPYNGNITTEDIKLFIDINGRAPLLPFSYSLMQEFFSDNKFMLVLIPKERSAESNKLAFAMEEAVHILRRKNVSLLATVAKMSQEQDSDDLKMLEEMLGTSIYGLPLVHLQ